MNVSDLREILQYVPRFRGRTFVIAVDGKVAASTNFANILLDLAVLRSLSIRTVVVHGASWQIEELARSRGVVLSNADGTGVSDASTLQVSIDAAIRLTNEIMEGLSAVDLRAAYPISHCEFAGVMSTFTAAARNSPAAAGRQANNMN